MPDTPQGRLHTTAIPGDISATLLALLRSLLTQPCHHAGYLRRALGQLVLALQGKSDLGALDDDPRFAHPGWQQPAAQRLLQVWQAWQQPYLANCECGCVLVSKCHYNVV